MEETYTELEEPFTLKSDDRVWLRLYPDTEPRNLEISVLQKGLVLLHDGKELIEEGIGFATPVVKYHDKTFFAGSAKTFKPETAGKSTVLRKLFMLDTISRKRVWKGPFIDDRVYSLVHTVFERAYLEYNCPRPVFDSVMKLRRTLGVHTKFVKVKPRGTIGVTCRCLPRLIEVEVDLTRLGRSGCEEILVSNEQGATFFQRYMDSDGLELYNGQIGPWEKVRAKEASFSDEEGILTFTLKNLNGAVLYRGWEQIKGGISWAGLSYSLSPKVSTFAYTLEIKQSRAR